MADRGKERPARRSWRKLALGIGGTGVVAGALSWVCGPSLLAKPQPAAQMKAAPTPPPAAAPSDYSSRVVAYLHQNTPITREELGEYLIARRGAEKLNLLLDTRIIEIACKAKGIEVTAAEIDADLAEDLKRMGGISETEFVKTVLPRYKVGLYEWKKDFLRPMLLMRKLCRDKIHVTEDDVRQAYDAAYGEKAVCRVIYWPPDEAKEAVAEYPRLRDSAEVFEDKAKHQHTIGLAAVGGKFPPIGRGTTGDENLEREAFKLRPGEVSPLLTNLKGLPKGVAVLKCDQRVPADTVALDAVRAQLEKEVIDKKVALEMRNITDDLRKQAEPKLTFPAADKSEKSVEELRQCLLAGPHDSRQVLAVLFHNHTVTREDLGEFLIARYGTEALQYLVNGRIIDEACATAGVAVSAEEVETAFAEDLRKMELSKEDFVKSVLAGYRKNLYEYKTDLLRPKLLMRKLVQSQVRVEQEDLRKAFESYFGEKVACRMILWPVAERKHAMAEYAKLRDSEEEFSRKAKQQVSPSLAAKGGSLGEVGRYTLGNEELEREVFALPPGEVTRLIDTSEGIAMVRCDRRVPPNPAAKLEEQRAWLEQEVLARKTQAEIPHAFAELAKQANPRLILRDYSKPENLTAEVIKELTGKDVAEKAPHGKPVVPVGASSNR
jgi:parvulin-like peptidyl-prolyl isomerase